MTIYHAWHTLTKWDYGKEKSFSYGYDEEYVSNFKLLALLWSEALKTTAYILNRVPI